MKYIKHDIPHLIKQNINYYLKVFTSNDYEKKFDREFINSFFEDDIMLNEVIDFDMNKEKDFIKSDIYNAKLIYQTFSHISESQASDERFWVTLSLNKKHKDYLLYRWGETPRTIKYRFVFYQQGRRGMIFHGLARLWWITHLTHDPSLNDPYLYTKLIFKHPRIIQMFYRNFASSKNIRFSILMALKKYIEENGKIPTHKLDGLYKAISLLGSSRLIDVIPREKLSKTFYGILIDESI